MCITFPFAILGAVDKKVETARRFNMWRFSKVETSELLVNFYSPDNGMMRVNFQILNLFTFIFNVKWSVET